MAIHLTTERLSLSEVTRADAPEITRILQDPAIYRNTLNIPFPYHLEHALAWIESVEENRAAGTGGWTFAIRFLREEKLLGVIGLGPVTRHDETEAGYWLDQACWGRGIATEALREVISFAFAQGVHRVSARHFTGNPASGRVMQKAGMTREGLLKESLKKEGRYYDDVCYAILNPGQKHLRAFEQDRA